MNSAALKIITGATLILPHGQQREGTVLIEGNRIRAITPEPPASLLLQEHVEVISGEGCYLSPGLIELHFNGAFGCNLNQTNIAEVQDLLKKLPAHGVTSALFTVITAPLTDMLSAIHTLDEAIHHKTAGSCRPLGLHLEGPFLNPSFRGTHPPADILPLGMDELKLLMSPNLKLMTLAPELDEDGRHLRYLSDQGVRPSLGHSNATLAEARQAVDNGANSVTHIYNAMRPFHHREPGLIGAALCEDRLFVQIIGDGAHVHPEAVRMVLRAKRPVHVLLTSDASPAVGMSEGTQVKFCGQEVTIRDGKAINQEGGLAGSTQLIGDCVRNLVRWNLLNFADAVQLATMNIAGFLNHPELGRIEAGGLADLVLWDKQDLSVQATFINGQQVYRRAAASASR